MAETEGLAQQRRRMDAHLSGLEAGQRRLESEAKATREHLRDALNQRASVLSEQLSAFSQDLKAELEQRDTKIQASYQALSAKIEENTNKIVKLEERLDSIRDEIRADIKAAVREIKPGADPDLDF